MNTNFFVDDKINFYEVKSDYINYLYRFDKNIVKYKPNRKYIGIIFIYKDMKYIAPLTSNQDGKKDYLKKSPYKQVTFEISDNEESLGFVRFGNMIPVVDTVLKKVDINQSDLKYKYLLLKQYTILTGYQSKLKMNKCIERVIKISKNRNHYLHTVQGGICDLSLLTEKAFSYIDKDAE